MLLNVTPIARNSTRLTCSALLIALAFTSACAIPFKKKDRQPHPKKVVTAKEGESVLIAGTARCLVPTKDFAKIKVGDNHACPWRDGGALPNAE
ncbi:MAG: hypothetical protein ACO1Q7_02285 [Gemmatimonas sp.]